MEHIKIVEFVIRFKQKNGKDAGTKTVECPECGEDLIVVTYPENGHTHGKCTSDDCLGWME